MMCYECLCDDRQLLVTYISGTFGVTFVMEDRVGKNIHNDW